MNKIEAAFLDRFVQRGGIRFLARADAMDFIQACHRAQIKILGIDGFFLTAETTQPSWEHSIDLSQASNSWQSAAQFLQKQPQDLYFEVVLDD